MGRLFPTSTLSKVRAIGDLGYANPFTGERIRLERLILGDHAPLHDLWIMQPGQREPSPHLAALTRAGEDCIAAALSRLNTLSSVDDASWKLYGDVAMYVLYYRVENAFFQILSTPDANPVRMPFWPGFLRDWRQLIGPTPLADDPQFSPEHLFALCFQIRRAFHFTYRAIFGTTQLSAQLRADVWNSIFTHDLRRYRQGLFRRMQEISTLVLGPSGTGKDLVAQAIGLSRYIPFNAGQQQFEADYHHCHQPVHLAALPATLLESELFGHRKGAYTGAISDRSGYLETRHASQTVFLDEIGELPPEIQVKLLRVLQNRTFQRLGDSSPREFHGKIVSATHQDLGEAMATGRFREDLYYRLCSDIIQTPSLAMQLQQKPEELEHLLQTVSLRLMGPEAADALTAEASEWIRTHLPAHTWPGNMRELEQCVRSILIRGAYNPPKRRQAARDSGPKAELADMILAGSLTQTELTSRYYALVYAQTGSYEAAARKLGTDWRTVKANLDTDFLSALKPGSA
ncbi:MAG: sigma-54 factor interaction domain-containing protein [Fluviicoccus sp.]|uniref:sigma-54 factor interaction domain-containing protein n=1 Tax=Fluviicoccus sp. TaxID=2003552 RepID=UPI002724CBD0|nr:sigma-54 factor interaction domain-containing protein [Fluviicoccus sp.]MDO8329541.1 sigma-54 factor interaction domain-containing protein [Fluviicoccus sp.]